MTGCASSSDLSVFEHSSAGSLTSKLQRKNGGRRLMAQKLFVGGIAFSTTDDGLREFFRSERLRALFRGFADVQTPAEKRREAPHGAEAIRRRYRFLHHR